MNARHANLTAAITRTARIARAGADRLYRAGLLGLGLGMTLAVGAFAAPPHGDDLDTQLQAALARAGFTGRIESSFPTLLRNALGRPLNPRLADLGRNLFFDPVHALGDDNSCAGCHAANAAFGDTQSIAIGVQSNMVVGEHRAGPRNQRRTPSVVNVALYPKLMWNGRFAALSGSPFDHSQPFSFPAPESTTRFTDPAIKHLLIAHAHMPPTELNEAAGFRGTRGTLDPLFDAFDNGRGSLLPLPDPAFGNTRNERIRDAVAARLNASPGYVQRFGQVFGPAPITPLMFAQAIAEFEFTLVRADAPIDSYARGDRNALSTDEKKGALLFFGAAKCVSCHAVGGLSNEMFSDFANHNIAVPQIAPVFGLGKGDTIFDGPNADEDFGNEQVTGNAVDRYKFRTSPLRNVALQPAFFHNGAFTRLEDAIRHHLEPAASARGYDAYKAGVAKDLRNRLGPLDPLNTIDPLLASIPRLGEDEFEHLVKFVRRGLLDRRMQNAKVFCDQVPAPLPSGMKALTFEGCGR